MPQEHSKLIEELFKEIISTKDLIDKNKTAQLSITNKNIMKKTDILVTNGQDINKISFKSEIDNKEFLLLDVAATTGNFNIAIYLLTKGANPNITLFENLQNSPFNFACICASHKFTDSKSKKEATAYIYSANVHGYQIHEFQKEWLIDHNFYTNESFQKDFFQIGHYQENEDIPSYTSKEFILNLDSTKSLVNNTRLFIKGFKSTKSTNMPTNLMLTCQYGQLESDTLLNLIEAFTNRDIREKAENHFQKIASINNNSQGIWF